MEKSTISLGLTAAHGPRWLPLAAHATWFTVRARSARGHRVVRCSTARLIGDEVFT
jgi:hypothetical protein